MAWNASYIHIASNTQIYELYFLSHWALLFLPKSFPSLLGRCAASTEEWVLGGRGSIACLRISEVGSNYGASFRQSFWGQRARLRVIFLRRYRASLKGLIYVAQCRPSTDLWSKWGWYHGAGGNWKGGKFRTVTMI